MTWLHAPIFDQDIEKKFVKSLLFATARPIILPCLQCIPNLIISLPNRNIPQLCFPTFRYHLPPNYLGNRKFASFSAPGSGQFVLQCVLSIPPGLLPSELQFSLKLLFFPLLNTCKPQLIASLDLMLPTMTTSEDDMS